MRVKICGITNLEDALSAIHAGADALGFVFYPESPRYITPENAKVLIHQLPPFIEKVALFVNETASTIDEICDYTRCTMAQIHFDADEALYDELTTPYLRVIRAQEREDVLNYSNQYRLIDAYCESYGGAGKRLNIEWFNGIDCSKIILAGGLDPLNVAEVKKYGFYGVDVSSGVERSHGKKDPIKVATFIKQAKS